MMITDGQILYESFISNGATKGAGLVLGTGTIPDATALMTACKYVATANQRLLNTSTLSTYLRSTLGLTILYDACFAEVTDIVYKGTMIWGFSRTQSQAAALASGVPTWGIIMRCNHNANTPTNGALTSTLTYARHPVIFSLGVAGSGADMILPGDGSVTAGQIVRLNDVVIQLSNVIS